MDEKPDTPAAPTGEQSGPQASPGGAPGPDPAPDPQAGPRTSWDEVKDVQGLRRPAHDRMVAGVAAGLARHLNIDPLVLRVAFVVLSVFGGVGVILYGALWLLLPEDGKAQAPVNLDERSRGVALIGVLSLAVLAVVGDSWGFYSFPWPLALLAVIVWFVWSQNKSSGGAGTASSAPTSSPYATPYAAPQTETARAETTRAETTQSPADAAYAVPQAPYAAAPHAWAPPPRAAQGPPLTRPRDPRRRGPVLFWFTLALIALASGALGTADLAGVAVADSAYPALALTISGAMLVLGAFWGRAGGIILIALVAALGTAGALAGENWRQSDLVFTPESASEVRDGYEMRRGELLLDLTEVTDPDALDDREIQVDGGVGRIEIRLPEGLGYDIDAAIGVGSVRLPGQGENGGLGISAGADSEPSEGTPRIRIATDMGVGEIVVSQP